MDKIFYGVLFGLLAGAFCRWVNIPAPGPPSVIGALMVFSVSAGYHLVDSLIARNAVLQQQRPNTTRHQCGGHTGLPAEPFPKPIGVSQQNMLATGQKPSRQPELGRHTTEKEIL